MMKTRSLLLLCLLFGCLFSGFAQENYPNLTLSPAQPQPGKSLKFTYDPKGTDLAGQQVEAVAYVFAHDKLETLDLPLTQAKGVWKGSVPTSAQTTGFYLFFKADEAFDNNQGKGYSFLLYDRKKNPVKGAYGGLANAQSGWVYLMHLERDTKGALANFEKEFSRFPENKLPFIVSYANVLAEEQKEEAPGKIIPDLDALAQRPDLTAEQLANLSFQYRRFKAADKASDLADRSKEKDPKGLMAQQERLGPFFQEKDEVKKAALLEAFARDFPESEQLKYAYGAVANGMAKQEQYEQFKAYLASNPQAASWSTYNQAAWEMALADKNLPLAQEFARKGYDLAKQEVEHPKGKRPDWVSEKQWREQRLQSVGQVGDTYGYILLKQGQAAEALPYFEEAVRVTKSRNGEINERHAETLLKLGKHAEAKVALEEYISTGHSTGKMKAYLREVYGKEHGSETGFDAYAQKVEAPALEKMRASIQKKLISEPAPAFALEDLNGRKVSLADLKGKTVIVDFWATWCGPCISSFPSMQQAVNKYKDDDKVAFVFINSWENGEDKKKVAGDFLAKRNFAFDVLMDTENKTIGDFKVEGIPTKFIIDKDGNIRYKSVGFGGNGEAAVTEISMIVELLR